MPLVSHLLRVVTVLSLCSAAFSHFTDPTVAAFPIFPTASESHSIRLPAPSTTTCTFTYRTAPPTVDSAVPQRQVKLADVVVTLSKADATRGACSSMSANMWEYELCIVGGVKQRKAGDVYSLGHTRLVQDTSIFYTDGDQCATNEYKGPRQTTVKLACDPTASTLRLIDVTEPQTCRYELTVSTDAVCGDERFPVQLAGVSSEDRSTEDWFMEVTSLHGHDSHTASSLASSSGSSHPVDVMCSVYSLEARARQSELHFHEWTLTIDKGSSSDSSELPSLVGSREDEEGEESERQARSELVVVRHPGRRRMYDDEYDVEFEESVHTVRNGEDFNGQLAFVKLYA